MLATIMGQKHFRFKQPVQAGSGTGSCRGVQVLPALPTPIAGWRETTTSTDPCQHAFIEERLAALDTFVLTAAVTTGTQLNRNGCAGDGLSAAQAFAFVRTRPTRLAELCCLYVHILRRLSRHATKLDTRQSVG